MKAATSAFKKWEQELAPLEKNLITLEKYDKLKAEGKRPAHFNQPFRPSRQGPAGVSAADLAASNAEKAARHEANQIEQFNIEYTLLQETVNSQKVTLAEWDIIPAAGGHNEKLHTALTTAVSNLANVPADLSLAVTDFTYKKQQAVSAYNRRKENRVRQPPAPAQPPLVGQAQAGAIPMDQDNAVAGAGNPNPNQNPNIDVLFEDNQRLNARIADLERLITSNRGRRAPSNHTQDRGNRNNTQRHNNSNPNRRGPAQGARRPANSHANGQRSGNANNNQRERQRSSQRGRSASTQRSQSRGRQTNSPYRERDSRGRQHHAGRGGRGRGRNRQPSRNRSNSQHRRTNGRGSRN